jgi:Amt family ammonium transporter
MKGLRALAVTAAAMALTGPAVALAQDGAIDVVDTGDTSWILISSALVLMMTMPGLSLFYGGLVRAKNFLSVMLQCGAIAAICSVLWIAVGYTLAFGDVTGGVLGGGNALMLSNIGNVRQGLSIPESSFALFQLTFAAITPALMVGAWVDRARWTLRAASSSTPPQAYRRWSRRCCWAGATDFRALSCCRTAPR